MRELGLKLFKLRQNKSGNDLYLVFPIPEIGLHLSLHGISGNTIHCHIRSEELDVHEDISPPDNLYANLQEWLRDIDAFIYGPTRDSELLVLPMPRILESSQWGFYLSKGRELRFDFFVALLKFSEYFDRHGYFIKAKELLIRIPQLAQEGATAFDLTQQTLITFHKAGSIFFMLGFKLKSFEHQLEGTKLWKNLFLPMDRAFSYAKEKRPDAFEEWGFRDIQALENFYSDSLDFMLASVEKHIKHLSQKKSLN